MKSQIISVGFEQIKQFSKMRDSNKGRYLYFYEEGKEMPDNLYVDIFPNKNSIDLLLYSNLFFKYPKLSEEYQCDKVGLITLSSPETIPFYLKVLKGLNIEKFQGIKYKKSPHEIIQNHPQSNNKALYYWGELKRFFNINWDEFKS